MSYKRGLDRREQLLFPPSFDEYVSEENPVRVIEAFVESLRLEELELESSRAKQAEGAPSYDPRSLIKLYVYGYSNRIRSSRDLERATHRNVEVIWLMENLRPDHWTINEFRKRNAKTLKSLFRQFHLLCRELGLVGSEVVALDSTFFKGSANASKIDTKGNLKKRLEEADKRIVAYLKLLESTDEEEEKLCAGEGVREALGEMQKRREDLQKRLREVESAPSGQRCRTDPDSRLLRKGGKTVGGYQVQAAVETKNHLIVVEDTMDGGSDHDQLAPMAEKAREAVGAQSITIVADGGYYSEEGLERCEALEGVHVHVPIKKERAQKKGLYAKESFTYEAEEDVVICPQDKRLERKTDSRPKKDNRLYRTYYNTAACRDCPVRANCTQGRYRKIHLSVRGHLSEALKGRLKAHPEVYKRRAPTVEHPFGTMKFWMHGEALMTRGRRKVAGEISLTCLCYNLKRTINLIGVPELLKAIAMRPMPDPQEA